jgi:hypothetical protein
VSPAWLMHCVMYQPMPISVQRPLYQQRGQFQWRFSHLSQLPCLVFTWLLGQSQWWVFLSLTLSVPN